MEYIDNIKNYMIGCFNISLYSYFDIHRIFDLTLFRIWDFIIWWFDIDFILFDFNFDFILCISFLFIFLIHFFLKLLISFINNFIILNNIIKIEFENNKNFLVYNNIICFITFLFITGIIYLLKVLEFYVHISVFCFADFIGFTVTTCLQTQNDISNIKNTCFLFIFFYFNIILLNYIWFILIRFFFSSSYVQLNNTDHHVSNKIIDITYINTINILILNNNYIINNTLLNMYYFINFLHLNIVNLFSTVLIFYIYKLMQIISTQNNINIIFLKITKYLYNLNNTFTIELYRNIYSNITILFLLMYIIFLINFFGIFIKDFIYINIILNIYTLCFLFTYYNINLVQNNIYWKKKQLIYITCM